LQQLLSGNADCLSAMFVQFAPLLLQKLQNKPGELEKHAVRKPDIVRLALQSLLEGLVVFPQFKEVQDDIERILQAPHDQQTFAGLDQVAIKFLEVFTQMPQDQQRDVAPILLGNVMEKVMPAVKAMIEEHMANIFQAPQQPNADAIHPGVVCDGCNATPIKGRRFKSLDRHDYDLCEKCHQNRATLESANDRFHCIETGMPSFGGWRSCPWGKGFGKGFGKGWGKGFWGKGCGKGWGKGKCWNDTSSDTSSVSDDQFEDDLSEEVPGQADEQQPSSSDAACRREVARSIKQASKACKNAMREAKQQFKTAKQQFKTARGIAKQQLKEQKRAHKEALKAAKDARKAAMHQKEDAPDAAMATEEASSSAAKTFVFPVEIGDGRKLTISWNKGDNHHLVAQAFAAEHGIGVDELHSIIHFVAHAEHLAAAEAAAKEAQAAAAASPEQEVSNAMDVSKEANTEAPEKPETEVPEKPIASDDAPTYVYSDAESQLEAMGFIDRDLNRSLLDAHKGNVERILEQLL